jgi:hypothetical protein
MGESPEFRHPNGGTAERVKASEQAILTDGQ